MQKSIVRLGLFTCIGLSIAASTLAQNNAPPAQPADPAAASWKINCPGVRNVPMTADAEQSLPLQVLATLKCGEQVTVLANDEGYTVRIQTADGQTGYVVAMYLKKTPAPRPTIANEAAVVATGIARWQAGAPGCDDFMSNGILVESLTANGVTVQVSLHDTGWKLRASVAIANSGPQPLRIEPSQFILDDLSVHGKPLFYQDPAALAKNVTHQVLWTEAVAQPSTSRTRANSKSESLTTTNVAYRSSFAPSVSAPNYILPHQNAEEDAVRQQGKQTLNKSAQQIMALAMKPSTVQPNNQVTGAVFFARGKNPGPLMLRIPIGDYTFEFPLTFHQ